MPVAKWIFILTNTAGTTVYGEVLDADEREIRLPLSRMPTVSFKIPARHHLAAQIMTGNAALKCYRDGILRFYGPLHTAEENGDADKQSITCVFSGGVRWLQGRYIGVLRAGWKRPISGVSDAITIARDAITHINGTSYSGVSLGTAGTSYNTVVGPLHALPITEVISQLASADIGFEWEIAPTEPTDIGAANGRRQFGVFNAALRLGSNKPNAVFEYGAGRANLSGYSRQLSNEHIMNIGYILYPNFPTDDRSIKTHSDAGSVSTYGRFEGIVDGGELLQDDFRQRLVTAHVNARRYPRVIVGATPFRDASPRPFTDYIPGDTIRVRAVVGGAQRFDYSARVWAMIFKLDPSGSETTELEFVPET